LDLDRSGNGTSIGKNFPSFIEDTVLIPLGMRHTRAETYGGADPKSATFYEVDLGGNFVLGPPLILPSH
jgi:CubicO group peptidase (beta-lactamase class C family)